MSRKARVKLHNERFPSVPYTKGSNLFVVCKDLEEKKTPFRIKFKKKGKNEYVCAETYDAAFVLLNKTANVAMDSDQIMEIDDTHDSLLIDSNANNNDELIFDSLIYLNPHALASGLLRKFNQVLMMDGKLKK